MQNRFFVKGAYKYTHNNGIITGYSPLAIANNFLNALNNIPRLIARAQKENSTLIPDIPSLKEIINTPWRKEEELKTLKSELSALERKIQLTLTPIGQSADKKEDSTESENVTISQDKINNEEVSIYNSQNTSVIKDMKIQSSGSKTLIADITLENNTPIFTSNLRISDKATGTIGELKSSDLDPSQLPAGSIKKLLSGQKVEMPDGNTVHLTKTLLGWSVTVGKEINVMADRSADL